MCHQFPTQRVGPVKLGSFLRVLCICVPEAKDLGVPIPLNGIEESPQIVEEIVGLRVGLFAMSTKPDDDT